VRTVWIDASSGASGDMLLGALLGAGVPLDVLQDGVDAIAPEPVTLAVEQVQRAGFAATRCHVEVADEAGHRTWRDVRALLGAADLPEGVRRRAVAAFERLATAEAAVHGSSPDDVHFHEVGALDAIADVVGCAAGLVHLGVTSLSASTIALGSGTTRGAHGPLPVPPPAVLALLAGAPVHAGPVAKEMTTPTGAALLAATVTSYGPLPPMSLLRTGTGAGGRDPEEVANVLRLVLGEAVEPPTPGALLLETNVDDLDPRVWPGVLQALLEAGAHDAWLTPILMKKGRPAHTLSVLAPPAAADALRELVFRQTSTLGIRTQPVDRAVLERTERVVEVDCQRVRVKLGLLRGEVVNATPEWEDVAAAAAVLGRPAKDVLRDAVRSGEA
jgi:hypothetical protein